MGPSDFERGDPAGPFAPARDVMSQMEKRLDPFRAQQAVSGGLSGLGRSTPAEDVSDAVGRLNSALSAAARAGWHVTLVIEERKPTFAGEGPLYQGVRATISKQV
jgi:hypothetical protein